MKKLIIVLFSILLIIGCSYKTFNSVNNSMEYLTSDSITEYGYIKNESISAPENEIESKIIVTGSLDMETKDLEELLEVVTEKIRESEGYVQKSNTSKSYDGRRYYYATIRIPSEKYDSFISSLKGSGNVTNYSYRTEDVTSDYYDIETRLTTLEAEHDKVLKFYDKAETIDELMSIEQRLTDIQYEMDSLKLRIENYDLLTSYSTLELNITETEILTNTEENFSAKVNNAFVEGLENLKLSMQSLIVLAAYNSWLLVLALIITSVIFISLKTIKKKNKRGRETKKDESMK